jgi:hypothetical protein
LGRTCPFAYGKIVDGCGTEGDGPLTNKILENSLTNQEKYDLINEHADVRDKLDTFITALARPKDNNGNIINDFECENEIKKYKDRDFEGDFWSLAYVKEQFNKAFCSELEKYSILCTFFKFFFKIQDLLLWSCLRLSIIFKGLCFKQKI